MLSTQDNELLCRVGPGTPMGDLFRQYWLPAVRSDELPGPDSPPLRVMLLGEKLIAFRMTSGKVGLMQDACPHRGASMFFGRNEEEGLRCVYHGWKFDGSGTCTDMPSEPAESNFKNKVHATAYATHERNGIIWAYMGPRSAGEEPPLPDIEANLLNHDPEKIKVLYRPNNWMQGIEGELDTIHFVFLHMGSEKLEEQTPGSFNAYQFAQRAGKFVVRDSEFGCSYGVYRPAEPDTYYWRIGHVFFPFYAEQAAGDLGPIAKMNAYVPMDDDHTLQWEIHVRTDGADYRGYNMPINRGEQPDVSQKLPLFTHGVYVPQTTDWYGRFRLTQNMDNDYLIDREDQASGRSYTGIPGIRQQDMAMTETMGPIYTRNREHLGTTDSMIIRARRRWIAAAKALRDEGTIPPGVDDATLYRQRSGECILPRSVDWWEGSKTLRETWTAPEPAVPEPTAQR